MLSKICYGNCETSLLCNVEVADRQFTMPVKFPCAICVKPCRKDQKAIACDLCDRWLHFKCIDMPLSTFNSLASSHKPYYCHNCISDQIPFSNLTNKEIQKLFNHLCDEKQNTLTLPFGNNKDTPTEPDICKYYDQNSFIKFIENKRERDLFFLHCNVRNLQKNTTKLAAISIRTRINPRHSCHNRNTS